MTKTDHLALAKEDLAIAESGNAKREAYKRAAEHIAAHEEETGDSNRQVARVLQYAPSRVDKLLRWRKSGYEAETPYLADEQATTRAAKSHAKGVLKDPEQRKATIEAIAKDDPETIAEIAKAAIEAADAKGVRAISSAAIGREMDDAAEGRKSRKTAKSLTNEIENPDDPNEVERRRFGQRLSKINRDIRDLLGETLETEWTDNDAEPMMAAIDYTERLTGRLKEAVHNYDAIDWDEALASLVENH